MGVYTAVLEYMSSSGKPATLTLIKGIKNTTKYRTALFACIEALKRLKKDCNVKVLINSEYINQAINSNSYLEWTRTGMNAKRKPVKNLELWKQLEDLIDMHTTANFINSEDEHQYTSWSKHTVKHEKIEYMEDKENV